MRLVVDEYRLERADEVYLLSEWFYGDDGARQVGLVINQIAANLKRYPTVELGEERVAAIVQGQDPEESAGRLPRIFIWDDMELLPFASPELERLLIKLPAEWRDKPERSGRLAPIINTAAEKSWKERRRQIFAAQ